MAEYIEREALKDKLHKRLLNGNILGWLCGTINEQPAADVAPVVHGRWRRVYEDSMGWVDICSRCKSISQDAGNYCSSCGARMDGE